MESQRTLPHAPPAWEPSTTGERIGGRVARARDGDTRVVGGGARDLHEEPVRDGALALGRYRLLERLGRGGFGEVWRAEDESLHRQVAVKRIWLGPDGDAERAMREALAAARLSHPAIVALYEARAVDDAFYLISELVHGHTLARLIAEDALEDEEVLRIGRALCAALAHAHARGVIHRDIKPHNVIVPASSHGSEAAAKLTDFGGASLVGEDALTRTGDVLGTLAYMAPEQSEGHEVGETADLYALALVLYEALSGVNPVRGATPAATARRIGRRIEPLERRRRDLPRELTRALDAALRPAPRERRTLEELSRAVEAAHALERGADGPGEGDARPARRRGQPRGETVTTPYRARFHRGRPQTAGAEALDRSRAPSVAAPAQLDARDAPREPPRDAGTAVVAGQLPGAPLEAPAAGRLALPRAIWIAIAAAAIVWQSVAGRPGVSLLLFCALAPMALAPIGRRGRGTTPAWLACALAPALGAVSLAGAFPAIAGQARRWSERAAMGALGYWWLTLAEPLLSRRLWLGPAAGTPARTAWEGSLGISAAHVVAPLLSSGVALGAAVWAVGAMVLPWLLRGRSAALDVVLAVMWTTALAASARTFDSGLGASAAGHPSPRGAVFGAVLAALVAIAARALRGPV